MSMQSENINELAAALAKAQGEIINPLKDSDNTYFKSKYADLSAVLEVCRGPLSKNGLAVIQFPDIVEEKPVLTIIITHSSGQWIKTSAILPLHKPGAQEVGSCITYFRRYSLAAILGIYQEDDDAETAQKPFRNQPQNQPKETYVTQAKEPNDEIITKEKSDKMKKVLKDLKDGEFIDRLSAWCKKNYEVERIEDLTDSQYHTAMHYILKHIERKGIKNGQSEMAGVA